MKRWLVVYAAASIVLFASGASGAPADSTAHPAPRKPISALAWLADGVWTADASRLGPGMQRIETRYMWSDNGSFLRFNTHFISETGERKTYDGQFFWDPAQASLAMWYMDAANAIIQGPVTVDGDRTRMTFRGPDFEGKVADLRVDVTRLKPDVYRWAVAEHTGDDWKELAALEYVRK